MRPYASLTFAALSALFLTAASAFAQPAAAPTPPAPPAGHAPTAPPAPPLRYFRYGATELVIRDAVAFVRVVPENRNDIAIAVVNNGPLPAPELRADRNRLTVDGKLRRRVLSCRTGEEGRFDVNVSRVGWVRTAQIPVIEVRVPQHADVSTGGAIRLHMARAQSAQVRIEGCGDADLEGVTDDADLRVSGSPNLRLYDVGTATLSVAGAGDVTLGVVRTGLTVSIAGSGDLTASRVDGPTNIAVQGSGDVMIRDGHATVLSVAIAGSGDVTHNGEADRLDAAIFGAGDVRVHKVNGPVSRRVLGVGDIVVGR